MFSVNKPYKTKGNRTTFQTGVDTNVQYFSIREISLFSTPRTSPGETLLCLSSRREASADSILHVPLHLLLIPPPIHSQGKENTK